jgi:hypothetical protein
VPVLSQQLHPVETSIVAVIPDQRAVVLRGQYGAVDQDDPSTVGLFPQQHAGAVLQADRDPVVVDLNPAGGIPPVVRVQGRMGRRSGAKGGGHAVDHDGARWVVSRRELNSCNGQDR